MVQHIDFIILCLSTLFTLINPIGITPLFLTLTERFHEKEQKTIAKKGVLMGFVVLVIFAFLGGCIFFYILFPLMHFELWEVSFFFVAV